MLKVLYTSDIHGNEVQYQKLVDYAIKISADFVIIGGDIAPKGRNSQPYIERQGDFLEYRLPQLLTPLKQRLPDCQLFLMMGNDDCAINLDVLKKHEPDLYHIIHGKRSKLTDDIDIVGYSCVPITPFLIKDWEKFDLSTVPPQLATRYSKRKETSYNFDGVKSTLEGWEKFRFNPKVEEQDSIQRDLERELFTRNPEKTIYIIHTPPDDTNLDQILCREHAESMALRLFVEEYQHFLTSRRSIHKTVQIPNDFKDHVGSLALRLFIEKYQPYSTLHGHIHETVQISGDFRDRISKTLCLASGNHNVGEPLAVLSFDLYEPKKVQRLIL